MTQIFNSDTICYVKNQESRRARRVSERAHSHDLKSSLKNNFRFWRRMEKKHNTKYDNYDVESWGLKFDGGESESSLSSSCLTFMLEFSLIHSLIIDIVCSRTHNKAVIQSRWKILLLTIAAADSSFLSMENLNTSNRPKRPRSWSSEREKSQRRMSKRMN